MSDTLLPLNASAEEKALDQLAAERLALDVSPVDTHPATCKAALLPWLAWAWRVDISNLPEARQRTLIEQSIEIHRYKGTLKSIKLALRAAGHGECEIQEGLDARHYDGRIQHAATHYHGPNPGYWARYRITLAKAMTIYEAAQVKRLLADTQPARCELVSLSYNKLFSYDGAKRHDGQVTHGVVGLTQH